MSSWPRGRSVGRSLPTSDAARKRSRGRYNIRLFLAMFWKKVVAAGVLLLLGYSSALWRYRTNTKTYSIFNTRTTIHLEYEGPDFIEWDIPGVCSVKNRTLQNTIMICSVQGVHTIRPKVYGKTAEAEERFLYVDRPSECFLWYYQSSRVDNKPIQNIVMWIYDPENASPEELANNASQPSINSMSLSSQFFSMGEEPTILSVISYDVYIPEITKQEGIWEVQIPHTKANVLLMIKGNSVAFQDCFVAHHPFLVSYISQNFTQNSEDLPLTTSTEENILFDWHPCFPANVVTISHWETLYSNDAFNTTQKIRIPPNMLTDEERENIQDISLIEEGIIFLTAGRLYLRRTNDFLKLDQTFHIPSNITGTETRTWCWPEYVPKEGLELSEIILWTKKEVFLGYAGLRFFKLICLEELVEILKLHEEDINKFTIHRATYTSDPTGIALLLVHPIMGSQSSMMHLVFYNENTIKWELQDFVLYFPQDQKLNALFLYSALPNFVIWDTKTVYYSYHKYSKNGYMLSPLGYQDLTSFANNSYIHQVFIDYFGNGVIKMYNNIMLYFKIDVTDVSLLHKWVNENENTVILINTNGEPLLTNLNYGFAKVSEYPLMLELYSSIYTEVTSCPYLLFESSIYLNDIRMDKRDELTFWSQIVYPENYGVYSIVEINGPEILKQERNVDYETALGICTKNLTVTLYQRVDYEAVNNYSQLQDENMGHVMIQLRPSQFAKTCPSSNQAIHVLVGCYTKRHIVLKGYENKKCRHENLKYEIEKQYLRGNPPENKVRRYDDDEFVEDVTANFIIWEIHERIDFSYTVTMHSAGCVNEAQTWKSMIKENKDLPIDKVWGPENYRHCFSFSSGKPGDLSQPYEIINSSNKNEIIWKTHHIGFYVFRVKIIDPNYSFCELTTTFAIEIFGILPRTDPIMVLFILLGLIIIIFICLLISYFQYLRIFRKFIYEPSVKSKNKKKQRQ
ncbi:cation channel sperm-associated protein subunit epsilon isoform X3 [Sarcophilus harrisii]|uniref:cation channel sperm-associated protein subunit epsilon isoform X3 n=1 Tax=Sarcophilus harrisii TaxID=9305 RepID=UPI001301E596|nr:cation channel sperm-associated protein subunit epsilon isoform X3 [Sarcophilus harrisii]